MSERDNLPARTGRGGAYEAWFLTCTDPTSGTGLWLRSSLFAPLEGAPRGEVWFARFDPAAPERTFGIHRRYSIREVKVADGGFEVRIGESVAQSGEFRGALRGAGHEARWSLAFETGGDTYRPLPELLYRGRLAPTHPYAPNPSTTVSGRVEADGEVLELVDVPAHQGHVLGTRHAERWAWAHCATFEDEDAVVEAITMQARRGPIGTRFLTTVGIRWRREWIRLSKVTRRREFGLGTWRLDLADRRYRLTGRIEAPAPAMLRARFEDPDGTPRFCHNSEIASCRLVLFERRAGGFDEVALLESRGTTHAEWAGRTPAAAVPREHVEVRG